MAKNGSPVAPGADASAASGPTPDSFESALSELEELVRRGAEIANRHYDTALEALRH